MRASMSRKGNCWDNACSETLFGSLKVERLHGQRFETAAKPRTRSCLAALVQPHPDALHAWLLQPSRVRTTLDKHATGCA